LPFFLIPAEMPEANTPGKFVRFLLAMFFD
jgi:hypothetical protein